MLPDAMQGQGKQHSTFTHNINSTWTHTQLKIKLTLEESQQQLHERHDDDGFEELH